MCRRFFGGGGQDTRRPPCAKKTRSAQESEQASEWFYGADVGAAGVAVVVAIEKRQDGVLVLHGEDVMSEAELRELVALSFARSSSDGESPG